MLTETLGSAISRHTAYTKWKSGEKLTENSTAESGYVYGGAKMSNGRNTGQLLTTQEASQHQGSKNEIVDVIL